MQESGITLRPFVDSDYPAYAEVRTAARPNHPVSAESLRHWDEALEPDLVHDRYVAERGPGGPVVGIGGLGEDPTVRGKFWIFEFVRPEHQGRGVGRRLFDRLRDDAARHRGLCLRASVQTGEAAGLAFTAHRGFREVARDWQSVLDVASVDLQGLPGLLRGLAAEGIEVTTLAAEGRSDPDVVRRLHELELATAADAPRMDPYVPWSLEQFRRAELEGPLVLPEAWFLAKLGDRYVAESYAQREPADAGLLQQDFTGTRPEYRRRGLAQALKLCLIDYALRNGFPRIRTNNSSLNAPMWRLNERLGFRRISTTLQLERPLSGPSPAGTPEGGSAPDERRKVDNLRSARSADAGLGGDDVGTSSAP